MNIINWTMDPDLKKEIDGHYRTKMAVSIKEKTVEDIVKEITFDNVAPKITFDDVRKFIAFIDRKFGRIFKGVGVEVGGGCGFFSAIIGDSDRIEKIYSVEACENIVRMLMPKVTEAVSIAASSKIVGCVGDFNRIELTDGSVDFVFDFFSLHHSDDLEATFRELFRILKPGGVVICLDKARANNLTKEDLEALLDIEYSKEGKIAMGISPSTYHTRRMNGEKEYRLNDWKSAFLKAGFISVKHHHITRIMGGRASVALKKVISILPVLVQSLVSNLAPHSGNKNNLEVRNRVYTSLINPFPKEISLMIAKK